MSTRSGEFSTLSTTRNGQRPSLSGSCIDGHKMYGPGPHTNYYVLAMEDNHHGDRHLKFDLVIASRVWSGVTGQVRKKCIQIVRTSKPEPASTPQKNCLDRSDQTIGIFTKLLGTNSKSICSFCILASVPWPLFLSQAFPCLSFPLTLTPCLLWALRALCFPICRRVLKTC